MSKSNARAALHEAVQHHANRYLQPGDLLNTAADFKDWLDENDPDPIRSRHNVTADQVATDARWDLGSAAANVTVNIEPAAGDAAAIVAREEIARALRVV